jgi:hypothetical protein
MTLESANICSKLLTRRAGDATLLSLAGKPQVFAPAVRREGAALVAETKTAATTATNIAMCSFQYRNIFSWGTSIWTWTSALDPKLGEQGNGLYESAFIMCHSEEMR